MLHGYENRSFILTGLTVYQHETNLFKKIKCDHYQLNRLFKAVFKGDTLNLFQ